VNKKRTSSSTRKPKGSARKKAENGLLVILSGPSGVGKSTVMDRLFKICSGLKLSISATTRQKRPGEEHGRDYFFITEKDFFARVKKNEFIEWAKIHGNYYGTPKPYIEAELAKGQIVVLEVDVQGAVSIKDLAARGRLRTGSQVFVFLIPPSVDILAFRLKKRKTESEEVQNYRLRAAIAELQVMERYDYIVVNDRIDTAAEKIKAIINVEKERVLLN
jgi:guanylate kinase